MPKRRSLLEWERDAIVDAISAGENEAALAAEFGCSPYYPHILARRRGVPARPTGRPRKSVQFQQSTLNVRSHFHPRRMVPVE